MQNSINFGNMVTLYILPLAIMSWEWIIIALLVLLLFGGKKIPELMRGLGKGVKSFKQGMKEVEGEIEEIKKAYKGLFKTKSVEEKQEVKAEPEKKVAAKAFNPTFGVGQKQVVNKKSFHDACNNL